MNNEILSIFEYMEKEKGISRQDLIPVICSAIKNASEKGGIAVQEINVEINAKTGEVRSWALKTVVDSVSDSLKEIHIKKAEIYAENPKIGDVIEQEIHVGSLGRIAAQMVQQAISQWVSNKTREQLYEEYKDKVGFIVAGEIHRRERRDFIVSLGRAEATLPGRECSRSDDFQVGDHITALLQRIDTTTRGPEIMLSRTDPNFVRRMLEREVTEISDGSVRIVAIARDAGNRTKIAVDTDDPKIDPVGACVGARGARVRNLVKELNNEKIDIIRYNENPEEMLREAIKPAIPRNIAVDAANRSIYFEVTDDDMATALGRRGQNAKLTSKLLGWRLQIDKVAVQNAQIAEKKSAAVSVFANIPGFDAELASRLVSAGFTDLQFFDEAGIEEDLVAAGFSAEEAKSIVEKISASRN